MHTIFHRLFVGFSPFQKEPFIDLVRSILCAFYDDGEILVGNFLLEGDVAFTDQQIAESLGLSQRQVRSILEARLCKDFITEAENPTAGQVGGPSTNRGMQQTGFTGTTSAWYRMCPDVLQATWYRLTQTEKAIVERLKATQENESYVCYRCGNREFDSLRAVSLYNSADGLFHCDICDDILHVRENKTVREQLEKVLQKFTCKFEPLKERLESMRRMYVPRHIVLKRTVYEKMLAEASGNQNGEEQGQGYANQGSGFKRDFSQFASALSNLTSDTRSQPSTTAAPSWIREAQTGAQVVVMDNAFEEVKQRDFKQTKIEKMEIIKTEKSLQSSDIKSIIQTSALLGPKKEEVPATTSLGIAGSDEPFIVVNGLSYSLSEVRSNETLIDQMTDEEYTKFDELIQKFGFK